jgi:hypothetical protein
MGLLDDAIREHLELKRRRGADPDEVSRQEDEALGPPQRAEHAEFVTPGGDDEDLGEPQTLADEPEDDAGWVDEGEEEPAPEPGTAELGEDAAPEPRSEADEDVLEATPDFLEETPEHDRLWFEQKPPKDFDFDN